ncbi:MAG: PAS domain S-box protein [Opitutus sp.]
MEASDYNQAGREVAFDDEWRRPLLNTTLRLSAVLSAPWYVSYLASFPELRVSIETLILTVLLLVIWVAALRTTLSEPVRVAALQLLFSVPVAVAYTFMPPTAGTGIILALLVLVSTLYHGPRTGIVIAAFVFSGHIAVGLGWASGVLPTHAISLPSKWHEMGYWLRIGVTQTVGTVALVAIAIYVVRQAQRSAQEARRSEQLLRTVIAASNDGIWDMDLTSGAITWSDRVYAILGMTRDGSAITLERVRGLIHPDDRGMFSAAVDNHLLHQKPFSLEYRMQRGDGSYGYFLGRGSTIFSTTGEPQRMVGSVSDVTERRRMDEALTASAVLLRQFVKHTPAAVAMFDTEMRYIQASDRWLKDYQLSGDHLVGRSHYDVFPDIPVHWKAIHQRVLQGAVERNEEERFTRANGTSEWLQWEIQPWRDADGKIGGLIMFTLLVNDRKRSEQKILEQLAELQRWQRVTLGREGRTQQLKNEVNALCARLHEAPRYGAHTPGSDELSETADSADAVRSRPRG